MTEEYQYTRIFNLSSQSASMMYNGSKHSSGVWTIPNFVKREDDVVRIEFKVLHASIPSSFYTINEYNNTLIFNGNSISIPYGNYNVKTLATFLLTVGITAMYSPITCKYTLAYHSAFTIGKNSTMGSIMGLDSTSDTVSINNQAVLPFVVNFLPIQRLHFRSSALQLENYQSNDKSSDVFISIQNTATSPNGMIQYKNTENVRYYLEMDSLTSIDIKITDDNFQLIDFNGLNWYVSICIDTFYRTNNEGNTFRNIVKTNDNILYSSI